MNIDEVISEVLKHKDYFSEQCKKAFQLERDSSREFHQEFVEVLSALFKTSVAKCVKSEDKIEDNTKIKKTDIIDNLFSNLRAVGFISGKSTEKMRNDIFRAIRGHIQQSCQEDILKTTEDSKNSSGVVLNKNSAEVFMRYSAKKRESDTYRPFQALIEGELLEVYGDESVASYDTASKGVSSFGKWGNPDMLFKTFAECTLSSQKEVLFHSYEIKKWLNIDLIAPHEARNHARIISNYTYVAINAPKYLFSYLLNHHPNMKTVHLDCAERGIGLILFDIIDENNCYYETILKSKRFTPELIDKKNYISEAKLNEIDG